MDEPRNSPAWIYETGLVPAIFAAWTEVLLDFAPPRPGDRVLDVGCGTGVVARRYAARVGDAGQVIGVDIDRDMLAVAAEVASAMDGIHGDMMALPFDDGEFDMVACQQGLQFAPDPDRAVAEFFRVLVPGGRMALSVWTELDKSPGQAAVFATLGELLGTDTSRPPAFSLPDQERVLDMVRVAGFVELRTGVETRVSTYPSAQTFVETMLAGASRITRNALGDLPEERRSAFIADVVDHLAPYTASDGMKVPMETRLVAAKRP